MVADRERMVCGFAWRLWTRGTSFYISPRQEGLREIKLSLHGPDPRPGLSKPGFKFELVEAETDADVLMVRHEWDRKRWFLGVQQAPGVRHVMRLRTNWNMFTRGCPSAAFPEAIGKDAYAGVIPAPPPMRCIDVDLFVSDHEPYWPNAEKAHLDNAALGPLQNTAGQWLTAVATSRSPFTSPAPPNALGVPPVDTTDRIRGLGAAFDTSRRLWLCEQWLSRAHLESHKNAWQ